MQMIYRLFPLLGHKSHPRSFRIQSCSVLNSIQEGTWEHAVGRSCIEFYRALHMVKPGTCTGPSPSGPAGLALTGQQLWSLRVGSRAPALCHSHAEDSFPLQSGPWGAMTALSETVTPPKVAPELLSPRLSTEPQRAQPKRSPRSLWSRVGGGGVVEGESGRRWVAEPEGRKKEGVGDAGRSRKMWVLSTRKLASHQAILGSAWRGYYCFHSCCRALWLPGIARSFPELLLQSNSHMNWSGRQKTPFGCVCDPWWSLISFVRYILYPTVSNK